MAELITVEKSLLSQSIGEIKSLRRSNELMSARLQMFDDMMSVLHGQAGFRDRGGMSPDVVFDLEAALNKTEK